MKIALMCAGGYLAISAVIYFAMRKKCKQDPVFKAPKSRLLFYLISFTWGLPSVLLGGLVGLLLFLTGHVPVAYGWELCFEIENIDWGLELGLCFIAPKNSGESIRRHEHGHGIQNIYIGIFTPVVVFIPSAVRFLYRKFRQKIGKPCKARYSDIWFEKSADKSGKDLMKRLESQKKTEGNS